MQIISKATISFEFFPPKTSEGMSHLNETAKALSQYAPHFFSVTYGAGGSTRTGTLETITMLQDLQGHPVAPHLACIGATRKELITILNQFKLLNIKRIVALRGDLPSGMGGVSELQYAVELVALIREHLPKVHIDVAAYPEFHPQAKCVRTDIENLQRKFAAGANSAITQYFFNADSYFYFLDACAKMGITAPIVPGIMPITQFAKLARFSDACGAEIPRWLRKRLETYHDDMEAILSFGVEFVHDLCSRLLRGGAPGLHFYTLNKSDATIQILQLLGLKAIPVTVPVKDAQGSLIHA